jgi:hypothetical protein
MPSGTSREFAGFNNSGGPSQDYPRNTVNKAYFICDSGHIILLPLATIIVAEKGQKVATKNH